MTRRGSRPAPFITGVAMTLTSLLAPLAASAGEHAHQHHAPAADEPRPGTSVYGIDATFVDQTGTPVKLDADRGRPVIISMIYASCPSACPLLIANIRRIEATLPPAVRNDLRIVLVTFDPAHDTPAVLRSLAAAHGVDAARWRFLAGSDDATRDVAAVLGIRYRRLSTGAISHSSVITLLDREGVIATRIEGVGQAAGPIVEWLAADAKAARRLAGD